MRAEPPPWAAGYVHATADEPGVDFTFRGTPEDFEVEELALAEPSGTGNHAWFWVEKRGLTTPEAAARLAHALRRSPAEVRHAGLKDKHALTRQWLSVPNLDPAHAVELDVPGVRVLRAVRHHESARMGQTAGNRFTLRLHGVAHEQHERFERVARRLAREGLANYYGAQRFGFGGRANELGRLLVERRHADYLSALATPVHSPPSAALDELHERMTRGTPSALRGLATIAPRLGPELGGLARELARRRKLDASAVRALPVELVRMHLSALQSRAFNRVLAARLTGLGIDAPVDGDVVEEGRVTGPMPGWRMVRASGVPGALEAELCAAEGAAPEAFRGVGHGLDRLGDRRPLRVAVRGLELELGSVFADGTVQLSFELPPGAYATTLLEELGKRLVEGRG